ncbi:hypothetical protein CRV24_007358 [Beauveria bassiana]|nr:hypothetical protein CRV24_007358 [Beauveria bassiana]
MAPEAKGAKDAAKSAKRDTKGGTIKLKKQPPKHNKPGNWRDGSVVEDEKKKSVGSPTSAASPGPVVNQLDDDAREAFATGRPLEDSPDLQQCKHCKKSILKTATKAHIAACLKGLSTWSGNVVSFCRTGSHARVHLPAKVIRWAPSVQSQVVRCQAALDANAPVPDEDEDNQGPVDSDEETGAVMAALSTWKPKPLVPQPIFAPIKRQYQLARLHEQLQMATNGGRTNIFQVIGYGAQRLPEGHPGLEDGDAEGEDVGAMSFPTSARSGSFAIPATPSRPTPTAARG